MNIFIRLIMLNNFLKYVVKTAYTVKAMKYVQVPYGSATFKESV